MEATLMDEIRRAIELLHPPGDVVEIRVLAIKGRGKPHNAAGYFDDFDAAAKAVLAYEKRKPLGIYQTINRINPALIARSPNKITDYLDATTTDRDVIERRWLPVDIDVERPRGISTTDKELMAAWYCVDAIRDARPVLGQPIVAKSGNGMHMLYPLSVSIDTTDTAANATAMVQRILRDLNRVLQSPGVLRLIREKTELDPFPQVAVDQSVFNSARILRVWGTTARKGTDIPARPHRRSEIIFVPDGLGHDQGTAAV